jgi:transcriptional regulator with XRE-family HTH domain
LWQKLNRSKRYRESFPASVVKRMLPLQIRVLRKQRGWSQAQLAQESNLTQGVISRAENPDYGNLTVNTLVRIAAGFDCAFIGRFIPFSELANWYTSVADEKALEVPAFSEDRGLTDMLRGFTATQAVPSQSPMQWQNNIANAWAQEFAYGTAWPATMEATAAQTETPNVTYIDTVRTFRKGPQVEHFPVPQSTQITVAEVASCMTPTFGQH